jgi:mono/diheme cytochrome c family protein
MPASPKHAGHLLEVVKEGATCEMKISITLPPRPKLGGLVLLLGVVNLWGLAPAGAQNLDEGKSATQLFASSCVTCHRSAGGLAKGRMQPTLFLFLKDHYTTGAGEAWALSSYLASMDTPPGRSRKSSAARKRQATAPQQN